METQKESFKGGLGIMGKNFKRMISVLKQRSDIDKMPVLVFLKGRLTYEK